MMTKIFIIGVSIFVLSSCASMFNSGDQVVQLRFRRNSDVEAEKIRVIIKTPKNEYEDTVPGEYKGTPYVFGRITVTVAERCYEKTSQNIRENVTPSYWLNILGLWGLFFDPLTGYMWKYDDQLVVELKPVANFDECMKKAQ